MQLGAGSPEGSECRNYDQTVIVHKDIPRSHPAKRSQDQFLAFAFCGADTCSLLATDCSTSPDLKGYPAPGLFDDVDLQILDNILWSYDRRITPGHHLTSAADYCQKNGLLGHTMAACAAFVNRGSPLKQSTDDCFP
ncbi:hypothetical protein HPB52_001429 [Rhipicephalus sanguineus]|uniref:Uncharacterized protein n=1 Tax=Rhipicephalus sanguineus TaxID=34632 RepID=A0A9D4SVD8_RHISA|nr:hypothetical protein HPB52_001429 [Rhipicephalus sanguineus]